MDLAVRTAASPAAIWVIVIVMTIMTAILVSAATVADSWQVRADRRERGLARLGASVGDLINHDGALPPDQTSAGVPQPATGAPEAAWRQAEPGTAAGEAAGETSSGETTPGTPGETTPGAEREARAPVPGPRPAGEQDPVQPLPGAQRPAAEAAEPGLAETMSEAEAPTRPDLPPVPGKPSMPPPRSGEGDRAERSQTGRPPADGEAGGN